jgi:hypothetical protein
MEEVVAEGVEKDVETIGKEEDVEAPQGHLKRYCPK